MLTIENINQTLQEFWPEWKIVQEIGEGSHGIVYKAVSSSDDNAGQKACAIKVIRVPHNQAEVNAYMAEGNNELTTKAYFLDLVNDFVNEISFMDNLKDEEHVVRIFDHKVVAHEQEIGWDIYIRMELLTPCLSHFPKENVDQAEVIRLGHDICQALVACSALKIIHRDIKPENIFISDDGIFKLGDFGVARRLEHKTSSLSQKGTYNYMAPEVFKGDGYTENVDLYSLGIVLYRFMNNNRAPFLSPTKQLVTYKETTEAFERRMNGEDIPAPLHASPAFAALIRKACRFNPDERYQSATEMLKALEAASQSITQGEHAEKVFSRRTDLSLKRAFVRKMLLGGMIAAAVIAVIAISGVVPRMLNSDRKQVSEQDTSVESIPYFKDTDLNDHVIKWNDDNLEAAMRELTGISQGDVMLSDLWDYVADEEELDLSEYDIKNIDALSELTCLPSLDLSGNDISDIAALSPLVNLVELTLSDNPIKDIAPLKSMSKLTDLYLKGTSIDSGTVLASLDQLGVLDISNTSINDYSFLKSLDSLTELYISQNNISDLSILSGLTRLTHLQIENNTVKDLTSLSSLTSLKWLEAHNCGVTDITPLGKLVNMESLDISQNKITDINALKSLKNIDYLELENNEISDISLLSGMQNMKQLFINDNPINDISPLADLSLEALTYSSSQISGKKNMAVIKKLAETVDELDPPLSELEDH